MEFFSAPTSASAADLRQLDSVQLVHACAQDLEDHELWSEFLRRFTGRIRLFIRGTLRRSMGGAAQSPDPVPLSGANETDLFQNVILRIVDHGCAALRRFSGATEEDLLAYFAVISRSVVRDFFRRQKALKRPRWFQSPALDADQWTENSERARDGSQQSLERTVLAGELERLSLQMIENHSGEYTDRDRLIFRLYFYDGLSLSQISKCAGIELSKSGVETALDRLKDRVRCAARSANSTEAFER